MTMQVRVNGVIIDNALPAETRLEIVRAGAQRIQSVQYKVHGEDVWMTPREYFKRVLLVKMYGTEGSDS